MDSVKYTIKGIPKSLTKNGRARSHWRIQHKDTQQVLQDAMFVLLGEKNKLQEELETRTDALILDFPFTRKETEIHVHQLWCGKPLDWDGLASAVAPIVDAFTETGIIPDDSPKYIKNYRMTESRTPKRENAAITVTVSGYLTVTGSRVKGYGGAGGSAFAR